MGLYEDHLDFGDEPPSEAELRQHLRDVAGDVTGLEGYSTAGRRAVLNCMYDPYTRPYALAFLVRRGGVLVNRRTGAPEAVELPAFVERPWRALPRWRRAWLEVTYLLRGPKKTRR